jgi:signal peptidase I
MTKFSRPVLFDRDGKTEQVFLFVRDTSTLPGAMKRALVVLLLLLVMAVAVIKIFIFELPGVGGDDMAPTLQAGDRLLANRLDTEPKRGQLVLMEVPGSKRPLIRRVVGLPGERVSVIREVPAVDGTPAKRRVVREVVLLDHADDRTKEREMKLLEETLGQASYQVLKDPTRRSVDFAEITLRGAYFVMSDNRNHGKDSRDFGPVPAEKIRAVVTHRLASGPGSIQGQAPRPGWTAIE